MGILEIKYALALENIDFQPPYPANVDLPWNFRYLKEHETDNIDFTDIYRGMPFTKSRHTSINRP